MNQLKEGVKYLTVLLIVGTIGFFCFKTYFHTQQETFLFKNMSGYGQVNNQVFQLSCQNIDITHTITSDSLFFDFDKGMLKFKYKIIQRPNPLVIYAEDKSTIVKFTYEKKDLQTAVVFKPSDRMVIVLTTAQLNCK